MAFINGKEVLFSAVVVVIDDELSFESENAVQNKVVAEEIYWLKERCSGTENMFAALDADIVKMWERIAAIEAKIGM